MQGGRFRSSRAPRGKRDGRGGNGARAGGGGGGGGGHGSGGHGHGGGNGNGGGNGGGGDDEPTTTVIVTATTLEETTTAAAATTTQIESTSAAKSTAKPTTSKTTAIAASTESSSSAQPSSESVSTDAVATVTATAERTTSSTGTSAGSKVPDALITASSDESSTWDLGAMSSQTSTAQDSSETSSGALSATSSASSSSSGSSQAGLIAGIIVGLVALLAIGFLLFRFRRTRHVQRMLAPFRKGEEAQPGPYHNMDKPNGGMTQNMTGETLIGISALRTMGPKSPVPPRDTTRSTPANAHGNHLSIDTEYLGPAPTADATRGTAANSHGNHLRIDTAYLGPAPTAVSPVSTFNDLGPEVSPISPTYSNSNNVPLRQPSPMSTATRPETAVSISGSEARIVSIPARSSKTSADDMRPGPNGNLTGGMPSSIARKPLPSEPSAMSFPVSLSPGPPRPPPNARPHNPSMRPSTGVSGGAAGGAWRPPRQAPRQQPAQPPRQPPRQRPSAAGYARPPPLSINRSKQAPMWAQNAPRPAAAASNGGYQPYNPSMASGPRGPPPPSHRLSKGSVSGASMASSGVFSLTDAVSWPKPPSTPTWSPDRH